MWKKLRNHGFQRLELLGLAYKLSPSAEAVRPGPWLWDPTTSVSTMGGPGMLSPWWAAAMRNLETKTYGRMLSPCSQGGHLPGKAWAHLNCLVLAMLLGPAPVCLWSTFRNCHSSDQSTSSNRGRHIPVLLCEPFLNLPPAPEERKLQGASQAVINQALFSQALWLIFLSLGREKQEIRS